jgi:hypothetical protein
VLSPPAKRVVLSGMSFEYSALRNEEEMLTSLWTKSLTMVSFDPDSGMPVIEDEKDVDTLLSINVDLYFHVVRH